MNFPVCFVVSNFAQGVPATLNKVVTINGTSVLDPYPSWEWNDYSRPEGLRFVQSMEIDMQGRMWIIDVGRLNFFDDDAETVNGPARLLVYDLVANKTVRDFIFPSSIVPWDSNFLNDIVLDQHRGYAYITDHSDPGAIIVYSYADNMARRWENGPGMAVEPAAVPVVINGNTYDFILGTVNGIALSPDTNWLYYCPLTGYNITKISTKILMNLEYNKSVLDVHAIAQGSKISYTDGMAFDSRGNM